MGDEERFRGSGHLALKIATMWGAILAFEVGLHLYLGSHLVGSGAALFLYDPSHSPDLARLADFAVPSLVIGMCLGRWCPGLRDRRVAALAFLNAAGLMVLQPLWLCWLPASVDWWPPQHGYAFMVEGAIFSTFLINGATFAGVGWYRRNCSGCRGPTDCEAANIHDKG